MHTCIDNTKTMQIVNLQKKKYHFRNCSKLAWMNKTGTIDYCWHGGIWLVNLLLAYIFKAEFVTHPVPPRTSLWRPYLPTIDHEVGSRGMLSPKCRRSSVVRNHTLKPNGSWAPWGGENKKH
jgi:hypothetical protein